MAYMLTKAEFLAEIAEDVEAAKTMTDDHVICPVCRCVESRKDRWGGENRSCWCDYDSPAINYQD